MVWKWILWKSKKKLDEKVIEKANFLLKQFIIEKYPGILKNYGNDLK